MISTYLMALFEVGNAIAINHGTGADQGSSRLALWQVVNLVGTPLLAILFLPPVIDDLQAWLRWRRERPR
jgi:hypothetical protein